MINNLQDFEQGLERKLETLMDLGGDQTRAEAFKFMSGQLKEIRAMQTKPPMIYAGTEVEKFHSMDKAIRQVGMPGPGVMQAYSNGNTELSAASVFEETIAWHKAAIKVFEFMSAQMAMDLFKDDERAKKIYTRIMNAGYAALHHEAGGGLR